MFTRNGKPCNKNGEYIQVNKISSKPLKGFGVRADEKKMAEAHRLGIDTGELFRKALDAALLKQTGKCPTCGSKQK